MKAIKMILPVTAILFAVVAAFATTAPENLDKIRISVRGGACALDGFCTEGGTQNCTVNNDGTTLVDQQVPGSTPVCTAISIVGVWSAN
jgi:Ni,Fe-hydrogenase III small subunit